MTFDDLPPRSQVFLDANPLVYFFTSDPVLGHSCTRLFSRIQSQEIEALTSTHVLSEAAHRLMTLEAAGQFGWKSKIVQRLQENPDTISKLLKFRDAIERVPRLRIQILTIPADMIAVAAAISQHTGLLSNDALIVAVMQANNLTNLASHDSDFDRVPGITRYSPA